MAEAVGQCSERVYVCTSLGSVVRVNLAKRAVECVYRLHQHGLDERIFPVTRIAFNGGFFVTAADDGLVRSWHASAYADTHMYHGNAGKELVLKNMTDFA